MIKIPIGSMVWEIDEHVNNLSGLIIVEVELANEDQKIDIFPEWIGEEVTMDIKFSNPF
jgi:CYTH domain-containing protein